MTKEDTESKSGKIGKKAANKKKNAKGKEPTGPLFTQVDVRVGKIVKVWNHPEAERLYCEEIDVGEEVPRQIASGLREHYSLEEMEGEDDLRHLQLEACEACWFQVKRHGAVRVDS